MSGWWENKVDRIRIKYVGGSISSGWDERE